MERQMTSQEACKILASIHKDTYDNTEKLLDECNKLHKDNLKTNKILEKNLREYSDEIKDNTQNYANAIQDEISTSIIESNKSSDKNWFAIVAFGCSILMLVSLFWSQVANGQKDIIDTVEKNKTVTVQVIEAEPTEFNSEEELNNFIKSYDYFIWSKTSIKTLDDLTRDYTTMYSVLGNKLKVQYVTNDYTANLFGMSPNNTIISMTNQFNPERPHSIKKRITKCPSDIWMNGVCVFHAGDYQVEYYDLQ